MRFIGAILGFVIEGFRLLSDWYRVDQAKQSGAAEQRNADNEAEQKHISDAVSAADSVRTGNGLPTSIDPYNRDNNT